MSHFIGFVITTPNYKDYWEKSLEAYDENISVDKYMVQEVTDALKAHFILEYQEEGALLEFTNEVREQLLFSGKVKRSEDERLIDVETGEAVWGFDFPNLYPTEYLDLFNKKYPSLLEKFNELYKEHGEDWNNNAWELDPVDGKWKEYSTYNPKSKWDWYTVGGRWYGCIKTKDGRYVNQCAIKDIDFDDYKPEDYCKKKKKDIWGKSYYPLKKSVRWHITKSSLPFCIVVDGEWIEKGKMGWWGITTNEMSNEDWDKVLFEKLKELPEDSEVVAVDFHI